MKLYTYTKTVSPEMLARQLRLAGVPLYSVATSGDSLTVKTEDTAVDATVDQVVNDHDPGVYTEPPQPNPGGGNDGGPIAIATVTGLQSALDAKSPTGHAHANYVLSSDSRLTDARAPLPHSHAEYADAEHAHSTADVTGLDAVLASCADVNDPRFSDARDPLPHAHAIGDTTGLQTALDGKAATSHSHAIADVTNLQTTLDGKAAAAHSHAIADVTNLQSSLDGKAATSHTHAQSDVTGLVTALAAKQDTSQKGQANGYAGLDATGKVPAAQLPASQGGGSTILFCRKQANESFSTTSLNDSTNMALALAASKVYRFRFVVFFTTNAATVAIKLSVNGPAGATVRFGSIIPTAAPSNAVGMSNGTSATFNAEPFVLTSGPGTGGAMAIIEGVIVTGANAGNLQLRHGSETATATTILANSYGELVEIV